MIILRFLEKRPTYVETAYAIILLVPFMVIMPGIIRKPYRWTVYFFAFIFLTQELNRLVVFSDFWQIIIVFAETLLLFAVLFLLYKEQSRLMKVNDSDGVLYPLIKTIVPVFLVLCAISFISNFLGYSRLSEIINFGISEAFLVAMLFGIVYRSAECLTFFFLQTPTAANSIIIQNHKEEIYRNARSVYRIAYVALWSIFVFKAFTIWSPVYNTLVDFWNFQFEAGTIKLSIGGIISLFIILFFSWWLARFLRALLEFEILGRFNVERGIPMAVGSITQYAFIIGGFFIAFAAAGFNLENLSLLLGALGVGIGFGLQNVVSNFIAGIILVFERPITVGDIVSVDNIEGEVTGIGIRSSKIRQYDGSDLIVPNSTLISNNVINLTMDSPQRRFILTIFTKMVDDPQKVIDLMDAAADETTGVLKNPEPKAYYQGINDQSMQFSLYYWVSKDILISKNNVNLKIHEFLTKNGIEISSQKRIEITDATKQINSSASHEKTRTRAPKTT
jgi:small-conductance mechanosensitive channel